MSSAAPFSLNHQGPVFSGKAGADLSSTHYRVVKETASGFVLATEGEAAIGFYIEGVASGDTLEVYSFAGSGPATAGGQFAKGDFLKLAANGKLVVESSATTRTVNTKAIAKQASTADGDVVQVYWVP